MFKNHRIQFFMAVTLCLSASALMLSACEQEGHVHQYEEEVIAATCEEAGERIQTCPICGDQQVEKIDPLGHEWKELEVITPATCEKEGSVLYTCLNGCGKTETEKIDPLDHKWDLGTVLKAADCENPGETLYHCTHKDCSQTKTEYPQKLGHNYSTTFTVDVAPTYESEGSKSRHCTRSGCQSAIDVETIPMLDINTPIPFQITVKRAGEKEYKGTVDIKIYDEQNELVQTVSSTTTNLELLPKTYKVVLENLKEGYYAEEEYELSPETCNLVIEVKAQPMNTYRGGGYSVGSVMYDSIIYFYDGTTNTISELLKKYKAIHFNFYFMGCPPCNSEWGTLNTVYEKFKDDILIIGMNGYNEKAADVENHKNNYKISFPLAKGLSIANSFDIGAYPTQAIIDREGVVDFTYVGVMSQDALEAQYNRQIRFAEALEAEAALEVASFSGDHLDGQYLLPIKKFYA